MDVNQAVIVNGSTAGPFDFPWEVDVYYKQTSSHGFERLATGALLAPNLIITSKYFHHPLVFILILKDARLHHLPT